MVYGRFFGIVVGVGMMGRDHLRDLARDRRRRLRALGRLDPRLIRALGDRGWAGGKAGQGVRGDPVAGRAEGIRYQTINSVGLLLILVLDLEAGSLTVLAAIRPDSVNLPLMLHVLGAMLLVGTLRRRLRHDSRLAQPGSAGASRFGLKTLLVALPPTC